MSDLDLTIRDLDVQPADRGSQAQQTVAAQSRDVYSVLKRMPVYQIWQYLPPDGRNMILDCYRKNKEALDKASSTELIIDLSAWNIFTRDSIRKMVSVKNMWIGHTSTLLWFGVSKLDPVVQNEILISINRVFESKQNSTVGDSDSSGKPSAETTAASRMETISAGTSAGTSAGISAATSARISTGTSAGTTSTEINAGGETYTIISCGDITATMASGQKRPHKRKRSDLAGIEPKRSAASNAVTQPN